jgi:hypothetical protein
MFRDLCQENDINSYPTIRVVGFGIGQHNDNIWSYFLTLDAQAQTRASRKKIFTLLAKSSHSWSLVRWAWQGVVVLDVIKYHLLLHRAIPGNQNLRRIYVAQVERRKAQTWQRGMPWTGWAWRATFPLRGRPLTQRPRALSGGRGESDRLMKTLTSQTDTSTSPYGWLIYDTGRSLQRRGLLQPTSDCTMPLCLCGFSSRWRRWLKR